MLDVALGSARSTIDSRWLDCSSFVSLCKRNRAGALEAVVHAEVALRVPVDFEPGEPYSWPRPEGAAVVVTLRLLDLRLAAIEAGDIELMLEDLAERLSMELLDHMEGLSDALFDVSRDDDSGSYSRYEGLLRAELQRADHQPAAVRLMREVADSLDRQCGAGARPNGLEALEFDDPLDVRLVFADDAFVAAHAAVLSARKSAAKPTRVRAPAGNLHYLLMSEDPTWRVLPDGAIVAPREQAYKLLRAARAEPAEHWDDDDPVDWETSQLTAKITESTDPLFWLFLIDDCTRVFAVEPVLRTRPDCEEMLGFLNAAWQGKNGLLQGRPARLALPAAYLAPAAREALGEVVRQMGVELTAPSSGFAAPSAVPRNWLVNARSMARCGEFSGDSHYPEGFVKLWADAQLLAEHAHSHFNAAAADGSSSTDYEFSGGTFPNMKTLRVQEYLDAVRGGDVVERLTAWRERIDPQFRYDLLLAALRQRRISEQGEQLESERGTRLPR